MSCLTPYRDDSAQRLLFKIASCLSGGDESGPVQSFNGRGGVVTLTFADVVNALGCTPACANNVVTSFNGRQGVVTLTSGDVTTALGFTPISQANGDARYVLKTGDTMSGLLTIDTAVTSLQTIVTDAGTINQPFIFELYHRTSGTPGVGFGGRIQFYANSSTTADQFQSRIDSAWVDPTHATRSSQISFGTRTSGGVISTPLILRAQALGLSGVVGAPFYSFQNELSSGMWLNGVGNLSFSVAGALVANMTTAGVYLVDGTAALPAYSFTSDTDTGMYRIGANSLGFSTGGVLRLTVDGTSTTSVGTFLIPDGTVALPGLAFAADTNTGIYRIGADNFGLSAGGALTLAVATTGINLTTALAYQYNAVNVIRAQTALSNYYFGPSGNLTGTGTDNIAVGSSALSAVTTGSTNVAVGNQALQNNTTGSQNVAVGYQSLLVNTTGIRNVAVGLQALFANTTATSNVAIGYAALTANTTTSELVAVGYQSLTSNTTGTNNTAVGFQALRANTTGATHTAVGYLALTGNTTGASNSALGYRALATNSTGNENTAMGYLSQGLNTTGSDNASFGFQSLQTNSTGVGNTALGTYSLAGNTTANFNVAVGYAAMSVNTTGADNVAVGTTALVGLTTGAKNAAIGRNALLNLTTGDYNTAIGYGTGLGITTGVQNTIIGANVAGLAAGLSNTIILADGAGNQRLVIDSSGNSVFSGTVATANGTAALPAKTFSADLDTGIYRVGANHLGVSANGAVVLGVGAAALGFFAAAAAAPVAQQVSGANLTNNVTAGGVNDTIADYADLVVYANDAAAIRADIYQLARKLAQVNNSLRAYGLLT